MYDFVIIHGSYGSPFENWFPWLVNALEKEGKKVLAPQFPCGEDCQNYDNWCAVLNAYKHLLNNKTTFIGHSLAPAFIVDYLIDNNMIVNNLFSVAPFYDKINIPEFDKVNTPFFNNRNLEKVTALTQKRVCFISDNDPYVPNSLSFDFANRIMAETIIIPYAGHFNASAGFRTFPQLLDTVLKS